MEKAMAWWGLQELAYRSLPAGNQVCLSRSAVACWHTSDAILGVLNRVLGWVMSHAHHHAAWHTFTCRALTASLFSAVPQTREHLCSEEHRFQVCTF